MKKYLLVMMAIIAFTASANAQIVERWKPNKNYDTSWQSDGKGLNERGREASEYRLRFFNENDRMERCGNFLICVTPVTWLEYWKITNEKAHPANVHVSQAAILTDTQKRKFLWYMNIGNGGDVIGYREASRDQIRKAHQKIGLHDDISNGTYDHGFFISISASDWRWWHE